MIFCDSWAKFKVLVWALEVYFSRIEKFRSRYCKFILLEVLLLYLGNNGCLIYLLYLFTGSLLYLFTGSFIGAAFSISKIKQILLSFI